MFDLPDQPALSKFYNAVGGGGTAATQQASFGAGAGFTSMMSDQITSWTAGVSGNNGVVFNDNAQAYAAVSPADVIADTAFRNVRNAPPPSFSDRWRAWAAPFGSRQTIGSNAASGAPGSATTSAGGGFGVERQFGDNAVFGFSAGGSSSTYSVADRSTNGRIEGGHLGVYGAVRDGPLYLSGSLGYGRFDNRMTREIAVASLPSEFVSGQFASDQFSGRVELGWRHAAGNIAVTPFGALQFANTWQRGYIETPASGGPAGILGLTYQSQSTMSLPASLGLQLDSKLALTDGVTLAPYLRAVWVHEFFPDRRITASFNTAPGFLFSTVGTPASADSAQIVIGSELTLSKQVALFSSLATQIAPQSLAYASTGGIKIAW